MSVSLREAFDTTYSVSSETRFTIRSSKIPPLPFVNTVSVPVPFRSPLTSAVQTDSKQLMTSFPKKTTPHQRLIAHTSLSTARYKPRKYVCSMWDTSKIDPYSRVYRWDLIMLRSLYCTGSQ